MEHSSDAPIKDILSEEEKNIKSTIPSFFAPQLSKIPSPSKVFQDYIHTQDPMLKEHAGQALESLKLFASKVKSGADNAGAIMKNDNEKIAAPLQSTASVLKSLAGKEVTATNPTGEVEVKPFQDNTPIVLKDRGVSISKSDIEAAKPIIFAEVSNRAPEKQRLEAETLLNTAINRMKQYHDKGIEMTLQQVLEQPNQYQGFNSEQYKKYYHNGMLLDLKKKQQIVDMVDSITQDMFDGKFKDNIDGSVFYTHNDKGEIHSHLGSLFK